MCSYEGKTAIFHYDSKLEGNIVIIDNNKNQVEFDAKDLIRLFVKEKLMIPKDIIVLSEILNNGQKETLKLFNLKCKIQIKEIYKNEVEKQLYLIMKELEDLELVKDQFKIDEYELTHLGYNVLEKLNLGAGNNET